MQTHCKDTKHTTDHRKYDAGNSKESNVDCIFGVLATSGNPMLKRAASTPNRKQLQDPGYPARALKNILGDPVNILRAPRLWDRSEYVEGDVHKQPGIYSLGEPLPLSLSFICCDIAPDVGLICE